MLTDKNRQATTAWKPLWILVESQTGTTRIASPATITIGKSGSEPYYILHSYMRYTPRQKTRATKIENEQGNCFYIMSVVRHITEINNHGKLVQRTKNLS